ncbi:unnamed protein product [Caenorhabditis auriculariae]|uniref:HIG1 domain-containing protein n=1 Tax=Caenorhabditis auriculariae TaxID=2777116 RepID=A0A8S1H6V0_9PELO|nr:unnamed protein product [Caenorhabditis auriculariae]
MTRNSHFVQSNRCYPAVLNLVFFCLKVSVQNFPDRNDWLSCISFNIVVVSFVSSKTLFGQPVRPSRPKKLAQKKRETESGTQYATTQDHKKTVQDSRFQGAADADSGQTPTKWQRRFLVITRLYKSQADIPTYVHNGTMNRMHDRMRVVFIVVATSVFFTIFFISERLNFARIDRDRKAGVVVTKINTMGIFRKVLMSAAGVQEPPELPKKGSYEWKKQNLSAEQLARTMDNQDRYSGVPAIPTDIAYSPGKEIGGHKKSGVLSNATSNPGVIIGLGLTTAALLGMFRVMNSSARWISLLDRPNRIASRQMRKVQKPPEEATETIPDAQFQKALSVEEENREVQEKLIENVDLVPSESAQTSPVTPKMIAEASKLKKETGKATFREISYDGDEFASSSFDQPPSPENPHKFDASQLPPVHSHSLTPFVNHFPLLRTLIDLGVDLFEIETTTNVGRHLLKLQPNEVKEKLNWLESIGFEAADIGEYLTRNPYFLLQELKDMKIRTNYLEVKKFTPTEVKTVVKGYRFWLNCEVELIDSRLGWIQKEFRLKAKEVRELIVKEPRIVMFGIGPLQRMLQMLGKELLFSHQEVKRILFTDPRVFMMDPKAVLRNYRYLIGVMKMSNATISTHPISLRSNYSSIRTRHEFLKKLGRANYESADGTNLDADCDVIKLETFFDSSDRNFAISAARTYPVAYDDYLRNCRFRSLMIVLLVLGVFIFFFLLISSFLGDKLGAQKMMQYRIMAQFFTVTALVAGVTIFGATYEDEKQPAHN